MGISRKNCPVADKYLLSSRDTTILLHSSKYFLSSADTVATQCYLLSTVDIQLLKKLCLCTSLISGGDILFVHSEEALPLPGAHPDLLHPSLPSPLLYQPSYLAPPRHSSCYTQSLSVHLLHTLPLRPHLVPCPYPYRSTPSRPVPSRPVATLPAPLRRLLRKKKKSKQKKTKQQTKQ